MTDRQDAHLAYHGDLEHLDHLECLGSQLEGKVLKVIKMLNILNAYSLSILTTSLRSAPNFSNARPARALADVM